MSGKANGKDPDGGAELSPEEQAQQEFAAGWKTAAGEDSPDTPPSDDTDTPPQSTGEEAAAGASSPDAGGEETPPADGADAKAAGEGAEASDGEEPPPESKDDGKEPDPLDARFSALKDEILASVAESSGKSDRELRGQLGRIQKTLEGLGRPAAPAGGGGGDTQPTPSAVPEKLKERLAKLRETDPETADAIELGFQEAHAGNAVWEERFTKLEERITQGEARGTQAQEQASAQARLSALMPDIDYLPYLETDENGIPTHAKWREFLEGQPFRTVQEFWSTDEPEPVAKLIRSFEAAQGGGDPPKDTPPADKAAGGGQGGGTNGSTQTTEPSADDAKRRLQREAGTGIPGGRQSGADEPPETADTFAAGWKVAGRELAAEKTAAINAKKAYAESRAGQPGI